MRTISTVPAFRAIWTICALPAGASPTVLPSHSASKVIFFWRLARPSHLKHPPISAFPRIDAAAFEPSRQPFLVAELEKRAPVNQLKVPRMPVIEIAEDKTSIDVLGHRQAHNAANPEL